MGKIIARIFHIRQFGLNQAVGGFQRARIGQAGVKKLHPPSAMIVTSGAAPFWV